MNVRVADYIADFLVGRGVTDVFTVTGGGAMHLNDAFGNHPRMRCVYNHHEQASAIAAEGYYKVSNRLPLVCVTTGPGGTNALTGVLGAWLDSVPMLVVSGQVRFECTVKSAPDLPLRQLGDQEFNIVDTVRTMTKYAVMVTDANRVRYHLEKALFLARNGRPGPVWIDVPLDVQAALIDPDCLDAYDESEDASQRPPVLDDAIVSAVIDRLEAAQRPAMIVGSGVRLSQSEQAFSELVPRLNIPIMTAWNSHDLMADDDALYAGRPGTVGTRGGNFVFQNCDLLIVLGCRMNLRQVGYAWDKVAPRACKIMVDIDPAEMKKKTFHVDIPIHADCAEFIQKLAASGYSKRSAAHEKWIAWCRSINARFSPTRDAVKTEGLNPYMFFRRFFELLPESQIVACSNGSACVIPFQVAAIKRGQRMFTNSGCASMGYGLPAAIGAAVAATGERIICLEGDGSIQMNIQELQTVVQNGLPIKIVIVSNDGYHSIRQTQVNFFQSRFTGVDSYSGLSFPDFRKLADAYCIRYARVDGSSRLEEMVPSLLDDDRPVIWEVVVDTAQNFTPKSSSKLMPDGKMVSAPLDDMFPFLTEAEYESCRYKGDLDELGQGS
jgi:acetolactate synthase I/II/III large subunit